MSATDVVCSVLTVRFAAAAMHELRHRVLPRSSAWRVRIDGLLHAVVAVTMSGVPWSGSSAPR